MKQTIFFFILLSFILLLLSISSTDACNCNGRGLCNILANTCVCKDINAVNSLSGGQTLAAGSALVSSNGLFRAEMRTDGTFIVIGGDGQNYTRTGTAGSGLLFTTNGVLQIGLSIISTVLSLLNSSPMLVLRNDGELAIYSQPLLGSVTLEWGSGTGAAIAPTSDDYLYGGSNCEIAKCGGLLPSAPLVCSSKGTCNGLGECICSDGYFGGLCNVLSCAGISQLNGSVCSGKGTCDGMNLCNCQNGFLGSTCEAFKCFDKFMNDTNVCNLGSCLGPDLCQCPLGYFGLNCSIPKCFGLLGNETNVCGAKGSCIAPDKCLCQSDILGDVCNVFKCFNKLSNETNVCGGNGSCIGLDKCLCKDGFFGELCDKVKCFGKLSNETGVCGLGQCIGTDLCQCPLGYFGLNCSIPKCFGLLGNDTNVCGGNGSCISPDQCLCKSGLFGDLCDKVKCFGKLSNESGVCGFGQCIGTDLCQCLPGYSGEKCNLFKCFNKFMNDTNVCNLGTCLGPDVCQCPLNKFGLDCSLSNCFGILSNETNVCGGKGICTGLDQCLCQPDALGPVCNVFKCFGHLSNETNVCGFGQCVGADICSCLPGYGGERCDILKCGNFLANETGVCNGLGLCTQPGKCLCNQVGVLGDLCNVFDCFGKLSNQSGVCGLGSCILPNICNCPLDVFGFECNDFKCGLLWKNESSVCNSKGSCIGPNLCQCLNGYGGQFCQDFSCFGKVAGACSNQGQCIGPNQCLCNDNYFGSFCNITTCFTKWSNSSNPAEVCSGRGQCVGLDLCQCIDGFDGQNCQVDLRMFGVQLNSSQNVNVMWNDKSDVNLVFSTLPELIIEPPVSNPRLRFEVTCLTNCVGKDSFLVSSSVINQLTGQFNVQLNTSFLLDLGLPNFQFKVKAYYANNAPYAERFSNYLYFNINVSGGLQKMRSLGIPQYFIKSSFQSTEIINIDSTIFGMYLDRITYYNLVKSVCSWGSCLTPSQPLKFSFIVDEEKTNSTFSNILNQSGDLIINSLSPIINNDGFTLVEITFHKRNIELSRDLTLYQETKQFNLGLNISNTDGMNLDSWFISIPVYSFSIPTSPLFQVSPSSGLALDVEFDIQIKPWSVPSGSGIQLQYAIGFRDGLTSVRLSEFSTNTSLDTYLPFIRQTESKQSTLAMVLFVKDSIGNVRTFTEISQQVSITAFNGNIEQLLEKLNTIDVASYDESFSFFSSISDKREFIKGVLNNGLEIDTTYPSSSLVRLRKLSQNQTLLDEGIVSSVSKKVESFVNSTSLSYLNEKKLLGRVLNKLSSDNLNSTLTVTSNILSSKLNYKKSIQVTEELSSMVLLGEEAISVSNNASLPIVEYSLPSFTISVSSFRLESKSNSTTSFSFQNSISLNLNDILTSYNGFTKDSGVSLLVYNDNPVSEENSTQSSHIKNFKFFIDNSLTILQNLKEPIVLSFPILVTNTTGFNFSCKYLDEVANLWKSDGCSLIGSDSSNAYCACTHTTMFSTFLERTTTTTITPGKPLDSNTALLLAQIAFGVVFSIISLVGLVFISINRNKQPIKSRFVTPYLGLSALLIECVLAFIVQRSVLVANLYETDSNAKKNNDYAANILANIVTIIVNTINLTAILSYLIQVSRFQILKYLYHIMRSRSDQEMAKQIKHVRRISSNKLFATILSIFAVLNVIYWTVLVILLRTGVLTAEIYTYIVSISYSAIIILLGICISSVILFDGISYMSIEKKRRNLIDAAMSRIMGNLGSENGQKTTREFFLVRLKNWFTSLDGPLYFRAEMICFLISFFFLLANQIIGLSTLSLRNLSNSSQTAITNISIDTSLIVTDSLIFAFEILYAIWYVLVFGGLASFIFTKMNIRALLEGKLNSKKKQNQGNQVALEESSELGEDMKRVFDDQDGYNLFEVYCIKEMASENLYLFKELQSSVSLTRSATISVPDLYDLLTNVRKVYIASGATCEVNISAKCRKEFEAFYFRVERMKKSEIHEIFNSNSSTPPKSANNKKYVLTSWIHKSPRETHHSISSETALVNGPPSPKSTDSIDTLKEGEMLTSRQVTEGIETLKQEVIINLGDTFSRFIFTKEYKLLQQTSLQKTQLLETTNLV
ncbi:predicted protein [Naegleria gruberi]|uniref:Predicted protein n=1 Tax=Naegleria gruberi TaxID=5762 RepID=D2W1H7_NAEGR|nr:uncharacterized protein NAEGRDRAFT_59845 [Naegleria gruberi]EFC37047.1 predicted protein [Naegleria gruberi]|eukprot:XP_002669791.1 predicted protein [Naegleria gruberi strain NEG-M]